ncbi:MAG TPA: hypothetical protein VMF69_15270 [Gemmataceae bacterium]|nr:hypothetical protein [Gemmataceae bacterium]
MTTNGDALYQFVTNAENRKLMRTWALRAAAKGISATYAAALKMIYRQLTTAPSTWGDPCNRLAHLGLTVYHRVYAPLYVSYAVDEERRIVYLKTLSALPRSGLETDE